MALSDHILSYFGRLFVFMDVYWLLNEEISGNFEGYGVLQLSRQDDRLF